MNKILKEKIKESLSSVLPITILVVLLSISVTPLPIAIILMLLFGALLLVFGMGLFTLGAETSLTLLGEGVGAQMTKTKNLPLIIVVSFVMGFVITVAEPALQVLAEQVPAFPRTTLIYTISVGVGIFLSVAMLRILYKISLSYMLIVFYGIVIVLSFFTPNDFIPLAFDSGGVTTGPVTVPFIMAVGLGLASIRADKDSAEDSFGLVALCSVGPILSVMILSILYKTSDATYNLELPQNLVTTQDVVILFTAQLPTYFYEVGMAIWPIFLFFVLYQFIARAYTQRKILKVIVGFIYTFVGLVLFLTGANVGFVPAGYYIGEQLGKSSVSWLLIPLGMVIGYLIVATEPSVHVLNKQVEEISNGAISERAMMRSLSIGVAIAIGLAAIRVVTGISIYWFIIPGYTIALVLTFFVPKIFTGIAFDSGGAVSGPMASAFILPLMIGACDANGGKMMTDAFGTVAMIAMTPLITIQLMGLLNKQKMEAVEAAEAAEPIAAEDAIEEIIVYEEDNSDDGEEFVTSQEGQDTGNDC